MAISRTKPEWHCLRVSARGQDPSHAEKVATILWVDELKGYMLQLHRDGRLDDEAKAAIQRRLTELEAIYGRTLG